MDATKSEKLRVMAAAVRTTPVPVAPIHPARAVTPFVTISREGGAGGHTVARLLVEKLNELDPGEVPWKLWDRELVEKVSTEHHISAESVAALGESHRTWLEDFVASLSQAPDADEARVYRLVAMTIRSLAQRGRAVIVGRGGAFVTRQMPGGVHCRLVAPLSFRAQNMAEQLCLSHDAAVEHVRSLDRHRTAFHRRYWPQDSMREQVYSVSFNTALLSEELVVQALLPLVLTQRGK